MLPSTGYFKTINCPFYENGSCDRPYCHFKHSKREDGNSATVAGVVETQEAGQSEETKSSPAPSNSERLKQLVTEAVKKVLADQEVTDTEKFSNTIVSQVVEGLKPTLESTSTPLETTTPNVIGKHVSIPTPITKPVPCVYNPTPIAELKKRHIPVVSYMPTRESRVAVKRKSSPDRIKPWLSIAQESSVSQPTEVTYKPTTIVNTNEQDCGESYVPTFKSDLSLNSYDDSNSSDYMPKGKEVYYPRSKKRREEYVPKMVKAPLKNVQQIDENVLDEFEPEFDMIDEILTAAHTSSSRTAPASEESQDYCLDIEPKFSDDEPMEDTEGPSKTTIKPISEKEYSDNEKGTEKKDQIQIDIKEKEVSNKEEKRNHCYDTKSSNTENNKLTKSKQKDETSENSDKQKTKTTVNHESNKDKKEQNHSKSQSSDKKSHRHSEKSKKDTHKLSSSDRRHSSSSSKDKDKKRSSHSSSKSSSQRSKDSHSHKNKDSHSEKDRHKSSKHEKHKSSSTSSSKTSKSGRHTSDKKDHEKKHSRSGHRSDSSKKSTKHKESSSERCSSDHEEKSNSSIVSAESFIGDNILETSDSDHDVQEECLKIFQEYQVTDHPKMVSVKETSKQEPDENEEVGKKRVAHPSATSICREMPEKPPKPVNPQLKVYERWRLMREAAAEKAAEKAAAKESLMSNPASQSSSNKSETTVTSSNNDAQLNGNGRIRIAHVPYAMSLAIQKKKVAEIIKQDNKSVDDKTAAKTAKGGVRVAHIPQVVPQLIRPEPLQVANQKFPLNVRQYYVNMMHDICIQIYTNAEDAAQRAVREEHACHERCKALAVYKNSCMLAAHRLRKEIEQSELPNGPATSGSGTVSHEAVLAGKTKGTWSVMKTKRSIVDFKGCALYNMLKKWILTEQQLRDNGFPRPHPDGPKGRAKIYVTNSRNQNALTKVPNERVCSRCNTPYMVNKQGFSVDQQNCIYHWGRKFSVRGESKYSCCQQYGSATGCCDAKSHVWDYIDYENLRGYVKTLHKDVPPEAQGVYALDCEMCYTTHGLELTRVTIINEDCNVLYETLVKPQNPIIDYNTRFSGITESDMENVTTTLLDVQATLLTMFSNKTILVGHSLESDFKALRLLHDTVVDTSIMFPHRNGYPQKRALKNLCSEYLRKIIQNDVGGHDSKEDAVACMQLIQWKVKEEAKLQ